ncbi:MAG TPA: CRISPR-associated endonuclease Cas1, partial [Chromatiaceae bacterium]|nr:CRISPR-associated endonuclease Cas1 [Chromatiaceae bacterium]
AVEAQAAGIYWDAMRIVLGEYGFRERIKRPEKRRGASEDIVNKALNTGYNLLAGTLWKYVLRFSLDPYMGYLHVERPGRLSLVYDLVEPYRPIYDRFTASLLRRGVISGDMSAKTFYKTLREKYYEEFLAHRLRYQGRRCRLETTMFLYVESIVSYLNGRRASIKPPRISW